VKPKLTARGQQLQSRGRQRTSHKNFGLGGHTNPANAFLKSPTIVASIAGVNFECTLTRDSGTLQHRLENHSPRKGGRPCLWLWIWPILRYC
jgi:hypothetical protein